MTLRALPYLSLIGVGYLLLFYGARMGHPRVAQTPNRIRVLFNLPTRPARSLIKEYPMRQAAFYITNQWNRDDLAKAEKRGDPFK